MQRLDRPQQWPVAVAQKVHLAPLCQLWVEVEPPVQQGGPRLQRLQTYLPLGATAFVEQGEKGERLPQVFAP